MAIDQDLTDFAYELAALVDRIDGSIAADVFSTVSQTRIQSGNSLGMSRAPQQQIEQQPPVSAELIDMAFREFELINNERRIDRDIGDFADKLIKRAVYYGDPLYAANYTIASALVYKRAAVILVGYLGTRRQLGATPVGLEAALYETRPFDELRLDNAITVADQLRKIFAGVLHSKL